MARLSEVIGAMLSNIAEARANSDRMSARLAQVYQKDELLQYFPVPRIDIKELNIQLKVAVISVDKGDPEVVVEAAKLREIGEQALSVISIDATVKNYVWTRTDADTGEQKLVVDE
ncbi:MAG: hypothetical protein INR69_10340 [Mucilaginibacter polytrichastri]|nr:hypothetical protein [Mucilaginibacter polytrichastri]